MKLFLFDLDGTLITTGGAGLRALDSAFLGLHGLPKAMEGISPHGKTDPLIIQEVFQKKLGRSASTSDTELLCAHYLQGLERELRNGTHYQVMEGVKELLNRLTSLPEILLGLGTGNLEQGARLKLEPSGLNPRFPFGGFGSDAEERPELLRIGVRRAEAWAGERIRPEDVYVIGDTALDVGAGRAIGAVTVGVAKGSQDRESLLHSKPDIFLESLKSWGSGNIPPFTAPA